MLRFDIVCLSCTVALGLHSSLTHRASDDEAGRERTAQLTDPVGPSSLLLPGVDMFPTTFDIPPILHQTTQLKLDCIPNLVQSFSDGIQRRLTDDNFNIEFLKKYFHPRVAEVYNWFPYGQHKADLYRYAALYIHGGIYADIKIAPAVPFLSIFPSNATKFTWYSTACYAGGCAFNGFMASPPRNSHFLAMVHYIVEHAPPENYHQYVKRDGELLKEQYGVTVENDELKSGTYDAKHSRLVLMDEDCSVGAYTRTNQGPDERTDHSHGTHECDTVRRPDLYGYCCNLYSAEFGSKARRLVAHTRDPDYPFGTKWYQCFNVTEAQDTRPKLSAQELTWLQRS